MYLQNLFWIQQSPRLRKKLIVTRLSRGNVSLQSGRYVTEQEITERYNKIKKFDFI